MEEKGLINLEYLSILELNGKGSFELLQGQITSDMQKVTQDNCVIGSICDLKGRVVSSFVIAVCSEKEHAYYLIGNKEVLETTKIILEKYKPFYESTIEENNKYQFYAIQEEDLKDKFAKTNLDNTFQDYGHFFRLHYLNKKFHLIASKEADYFKNYKISNNKNLWKLDEINNQNYEISSETVSRFTPHELGYHLTERVDFEKGCYTGQEIVARMHYRAKKLPKIVIKSTKKQIEDLEKVQDKKNNSLGIILSCAVKENQKYALLSMNKNYIDQELDL